MKHHHLVLLTAVLAACEEEHHETPNDVWCVNVENELDCPNVDEASEELVGKSSCGTVVEEVLGLAYREDRGDHAGCCYDVFVTRESDTCD